MMVEKTCARVEPMEKDHKLITWSRSAWLPVILGLVLTSCTTVGPDYEPPSIEVPSAFTAERARGLAEGEPELAEWWTRLSDPVLDGLVTRALEGNYDLARAMARIREARALRGITATELFPTVDATGSYSRVQNSRETAGGAFAPRAFDDFHVGAEAIWEIDLWGRIRRNIEAADGEIDVSVEDARGLVVSIIAETALTYVEVRNNQERALIARSNVEIQERTLGLTKDQFEAGLVSELDVAQAASILESTRSTLPPLEAAATAARNRLAVLCGIHPGSLEEELGASGAVPVPSVELAVGVPSELLRRRPDLRRAERSLAAQTARIGAAEAELYPQLFFSGTIGLSAENLSDLGSNAALNFGLGPGVRFNLFDRDRLHAAVSREGARRDQNLIAYENAVLLALEEVENAMTSFVRNQESRDSLERALDHSRRALELSQEQYRRGLTSFQSVLDSQRRLFEVEDRLALMRAYITADLIGIYRALGGGWESRDIVLLPGEDQ